jgi:TolB-like protein/Flp pilus assembly protein TadD
MLGLPVGSVTIVLGAAALGFPVALILSWLFDFTRQGVVEAPTATDSPQHMSWSIFQIVEVVVLSMLTLLVGYLFLDRLVGSSSGKFSAADQPSAQVTSIAVMPFVNMSGLERMDYLGDGLAEDVLNQLAQLRGFKVAARTSSFYFKDKKIDIQAVGKRLNVGHVLEGSVRQGAGRVRVTAQLIDVNNGYHVWSKTYERKLENMLAVQHEIASQIVSALGILFSPEPSSMVSPLRDVDPATYDYYLQGKAYLRMPMDTVNLQLAVVMFKKAVATDAEFAGAYAGLCDSRLAQYSLNLDIARFREAEAACQRALVLDRRAASVYTALGNLYVSSGQYDQAILEFNTAIALGNSSADAYLGLAEAYLHNNDPQSAEQAYGNAIDLQPNYWKAYMSMGDYLFGAGRAAEAIPYYRRITELMPQSESALDNLGLALFFSGSFEQAEQAWQKSLALTPSATAYANIATSRYFLERYDEAIALYHRALEFAPDDYELWGHLGDAYREHVEGAELAVVMYENAIKLAYKRLQVNPSDVITLSHMGHYQAIVGERGLALEYIDMAVDLEPDNMYVNYTAARALTKLGERYRALDTLERALAQGYPWHLARVDPGLRDLHNMLRFDALGTQQRATLSSLK